VAFRLRKRRAPILVVDAPEHTEGDRKTVTAVFTDIKGSMELIEDTSTRRSARAIVDPALELMIDAVHHYAGYSLNPPVPELCAVRGDHRWEHHPQRALLAALRMQLE